MTQRDGGKGDRKRPLVISEEQFNANWDAIFKSKPEETIEEVNPLADKIVKQVKEAIKNERTTSSKQGT